MKCFIENFQFFWIKTGRRWVKKARNDDELSKEMMKMSAEEK